MERERALRGLRDALVGAVNLLLPVACAGCDAPDDSLCDACAAALVPRPLSQTVPAHGGGFIVWSGLPFEAVPARVVRALKEDGRTGLARALAPALGAAVSRCDPGDAVIVPMPTSRASYRRRGYRVPELLAARAGLRVERLLRPARSAGDQRALGRAERHRNVLHSLRATDAAARRVIVVDDVVTTGASLAEAVRALREAGAEVVGAATVAATARRTLRPVPGPVAIETHR